MAVRVETAVVAANEDVAPDLSLLHLDLPTVAPLLHPGQLLMVRCADPNFPSSDPLLPRAYFIFDLDVRAGRCSLLVVQRGKGSSWLGRRRPGDQVLVFGPAGRPLAAGRQTRHLLLLAEGTLGVAALAGVAGASARRGLAVTLVENTGRQGGLPPHLLHADVEYRATSPDRRCPSSGRPPAGRAPGGLLGVLPQVLSWADEVVVAAPAGLLETLAALRRDRLPPFTLYGGVPVQVIPLPALVVGDAADEDGPRGGDILPCGTGVCGACVVGTRAGPKLFCREGPAFALGDLRFDAGGDEDV